MAGNSTIFEEIHCGLPREGPGDSASTRKAFQFMAGLSNAPCILDVGCGPGMQTLDLADISKGTITALDLRRRFLDELKERAKKAGVSERVITVCESMDSMSFKPESFDVIWSEGAIYLIGFENGLRLWQPLLKTNGYIAVTELCWLTKEIPGEIGTFWQKAYPAMANVDDRLKAISACGYRNITHFTLPESAWWADYYMPMEHRLSMLREKYRNDPPALEGIAKAQEEIDRYREYCGFYGYVFFVMQKLFQAASS